jgi:hypothetical protein
LGLFLNILADSWFGLKANMNFIHHHLNKHFIFAIQSNRCVALSKKEASCGQFQRVDSLYLKDISFPVKLLTKIFTNEDGTSGTLYLISNDLGHDADRMYQVYQTITN